MRLVLWLAPILLAAIGVLGGVLLVRSQSEREKVRMLPKDRGTAITYVALGDSTVSGVGASSPEKNYVSRLYERLRSVYPNARLANLGVSGATASDVVRDQLPRAVMLGPYLVTLSVGPNDITQGRDAQQYERDIEAIFQTLHRQTRAIVVANLLPDLAVAPRFTPDEKAAVGRHTALFNEALARQARQYGVEVVDLYAPSQEEVPGHGELFAGDNYHPSDEGYARWANHMWRGVEARTER
jgi:acyl-CoA thioesterase-1